MCGRLPADVLFGPEDLPASPAHQRGRQQDVQVKIPPSHKTSDRKLADYDDDGVDQYPGERYVG